MLYILPAGVVVATVVVPVAKTRTNSNESSNYCGISRLTNHHVR